MPQQGFARLRRWQSFDPANEQPIRAWIPRPLVWLSRDFVRTFDDLANGRARWPLLMFGGPGTGKTTCGLAACDRVWPLYWPMPELLQHQQMIKARSKRGEYYPDDPWPGIIEAPFAVLDEIGSRGMNTELEFETLLQFMEERNRHNRVAIYITNLHPTDLERVFDARIADRLTCGTILEFKGDSKR